MKTRLPLLRKPMPKVIGTLLVLGSVHFFSAPLLAQEPRAPSERNFAPPGQPPANMPLAQRMVPIRTAPGENVPAPSPERMPSRSPGQPLPPPNEVAPARFEAMVYEVRVPEGRIAELESAALEAKAGTPQALAKALGEFGETKVLYKIDQTVNLYGENISLGSREPIVTDARVTDKGTVVSSFRYEEVGFMVNLAANPPGPDEVRKDLLVQMNCQLSALAQSEVELSASAKATRVRQVRLNHSEIPRFGKPSVLFNISASPGNDKTQPVAYVLRYVFREITP